MERDAIDTDQHASTPQNSKPSAISPSSASKVSSEVNGSGKHTLASRGFGFKAEKAHRMVPTSGRFGHFCGGRYVELLRVFDPNVALGKGREGEERERGWKREKEWKKEWKKGGGERKDEGKDEGKEDVSAFGRRAFVRFRGGRRERYGP